jgi:Outer membrane protein beta-barrel domain
VYSRGVVRRAFLSMVLPVVIPGVVATLAGGTARTARAAGEDEWELSLRAGAANATGDPLSSWGPAAALDLEYGLDDAWAARVSVGTLAHPVPAVKNVTPGGTLHATSAIVGLTYTFDVLRLVPYLTSGIGIIQFSGGGAPAHQTLATDLGVGANYLVTPHWSWGGSVQYVFAPADLINNAMTLGQDPLAFSITLRVSHTF